MIYEINHIWTAEKKWRWRNDRRSEPNLCNCVKKPEKKFRTFFSGFFTQLHKLRSLRRSFLHLHFLSAVHIWFISYIINTHFFYGNIWTHNWPAPNVSGFIAQLVEHHTGKSRGHGFKPSWSPELFSFSGFFMKLHKLCSLRRSFLHLHKLFSVNKNLQNSKTIFLVKMFIII